MTPSPESDEASDASAELQAVLGARRQLGPDYDRVFVERFVDRAEAELRDRAAARARSEPASGGGRVRGPTTADVGGGGLALAITTVVWGLLSTYLAAISGAREDPAIGLAVLAGWAVVGLADLVYCWLALDRARRRRT